MINDLFTLHSHMENVDVCPNCGELEKYEELYDCSLCGAIGCEGHLPGGSGELAHTGCLRECGAHCGLYCEDCFVDCKVCYEPVCKDCICDECTRCNSCCECRKQDQT